MKKSFLIITLICFVFAFFTSCENSVPDQRTNTISLENISNVNLTVTNDDFIPLKEISQKHISVEKKQIDETFKGTIISAYWVGEKIVIESFPEDKNDSVELGVFDPYSNNYEKITDMPFTASYKNNVQVISDRYYVTVNTYITENSSKCKVVIYDIENNTVRIADEFNVHNIVQYITAIGENGFSYFYYEGDTQDWVVKYYDFIDKESREIIPHSKFNDIPTAPVTLAYSENSVVLALQSIENSVYNTELIWINLDDSSCRKEKIDLYKFFDNREFEIFDLLIENDYYFIQAEIDNSYEYFMFKRNDNDFHVVLPAIFHLEEFEGFIDRSKVLFNGTDSSKNKKIVFDVDLTENTFETYSFYSTETIDNISLIKPNTKGDMFILYKEATGYFYQTINNFKLKAEQSNTALFLYPSEQIEYADENYSDKKALEIKRMCEETERNICNNDFRWKFIYG